MDKALSSMMVPAIIDHRVIPNGVDTEIFRPGSREESRSALDLPQASHILLFSCFQPTKNPWKDFETIREAVLRLQTVSQSRPLILVVLGEKGPVQRIGQLEIRSVGFERSPNRVADWYRAADLYVHAAHADTFPNSILEALACGTPVAATAVGGIPEQIRSISDCGRINADSGRATGVLTPPGDPDALSAAIKKMLADDALRHRLAENAVRDVQSRFTLKHQADQFLSWYAELIEQGKDRPTWRKHTAAQKSGSYPLPQLVGAN